jgi:hypothetical protein
MKTEQEILNYTKAVTVYNFYNLPLNINYTSSYLSTVESESLLNLQIGINNIIGNLCGCRFGKFKKKNIQNNIKLSLKNDSENPVIYCAFYFS